VLNYYTKAGRERRYTIGAVGAWKIAAARLKAKELRRVIDDGGDPIGELESQREAPTVKELVERALSEHFARKAADYAKDNERIARAYILPAMGHLKVADVSFSDTSRLHHKVTEEAGPYRANRVLSSLSKMMSLAMKWGMRTNNPCQGVEKNREEKRERYLSADELSRLLGALSGFEDRSAANALMLLLLTGARKGEVLGAKWNEFDLAAGVWAKPASTTKQRKSHRVPLSPQALELLLAMYEARASDYLFPVRGHAYLQRQWDVIRRRAGLEDFHVHDLRHSFASILASRGLSLPVIGGLLGHSDVKTTARYAHLLDDTLRAATAAAGAVIAQNGK
jgi:integrase